jgi:hypothetical protein
MDILMTTYEMCISNAAAHIKKHPTDSDPDHIDAFKFSEILGVCFCKFKEDVIMDLIKAGANIPRRFDETHYR